MILVVGLTPALQRTQFFDAPIALGDVNRAARTLTTASGKAVNVARIVHRFGVAGALVQPLGGLTGEIHEQLSRGYGIDSAVVAVEAPTRICTTLIAPGGVTELVEEAAPFPAEIVASLFQTIIERLPRASVLALCGSLPPECDPEFYSKLIRIAREKNVRCLVDAQKLPLKLALAERPWLVKVNRREVADALGLAGVLPEPATLCGLLRAAGARNAVVTDGSRGAALASEEGGVWEIASPELTSVNPIGSGDAMNAGILVGTAREMSLPEAVRFGAACAAANCLTETSGDVDPAMVPGLLERTRIAPLSVAG